MKFELFTFYTEKQWKNMFGYWISLPGDAKYYVTTRMNYRLHTPPFWRSINMKYFGYWTRKRDTKMYSSMNIEKCNESYWFAKSDTLFRTNWDENNINKNLILNAFLVLGNYLVTLLLNNTIISTTSFCWYCSFKIFNFGKNFLTSNVVLYQVHS